jgi:hypothetical protein
MQIAPHVQAIQSDLAAAASLGGDAAAEAAQKLSQALESSLHLRLLDLLSEVAVGLSAQLPSGRVEVRLAGRDPELVFVDEEPAAAQPAAPSEDGMSARITLRLPESLKTGIETAAAREGVSTNTWIVRALGRALEPRPQRGPGRNRLQGFAQS